MCIYICIYIYVCMYICTHVDMLKQELQHGAFRAGNLFHGPLSSIWYIGLSFGPDSGPILTGLLLRNLN